MDDILCSIQMLIIQSEYSVCIGMQIEQYETTICELVDYWKTHKKNIGILYTQISWDTCASFFLFPGL